MNELTELELLEVSLVSAGDDPLAKVAIFKQKEEMMAEEDIDKKKKPHPDMETPEEDMTEGPDAEMMEEEEEKACKPKKKSYKAEAEALAEANEALLEKAEALEAEVAVLKKALSEKADVTKAEEMIEVEGEMIAKSAIPAPILKKLEEVEKAAVQVALEKKAEELIPNAPGELASKAKLIKAVGEDEDMIAFLRAVDAAFAGAFEEIGKGKSVEFESPKEELDHMVKTYMDEHAVEKHAAMTEVTKSGRGRELLLKTMKKDTK